MKSRDELQNDYEEALFAIIMDDIMELEGRALLEERQRLSESDEFKVPDDVNDRCIAFIDRLFEEANAKRKAVCLRKIWHTILVAAIVISLCFTTVYATVPRVRNVTEKIIVHILGNRAKIMFSEDNYQIISRYTFCYIPDGFEVKQEGNDANQEWVLYVCGDASIMIRISDGLSFKEFYLDNENAREKDILVNNFVGVLFEKENRIHVAVVDGKNEKLIQIIAVNVGEQSVIEILENIRYE